MASRLNKIIANRTVERRRVAIERTVYVLDELHGLGVDAVIIGSLAKGNFLDHSDVDFYVRGIVPALRRIEVERTIGKHMRGSTIGFDVVYAEDVSDRKEEFEDVWLDAPGIRKIASEDGPHTP